MNQAQAMLQEINSQTHFMIDFVSNTLTLFIILFAAGVVISMINDNFRRNR